MLVKTCDGCKKPITKDNEMPSVLIKTDTKGNKESIGLGVIPGGKQDEYHFCKYCIIDAMNKADDRAKEAGYGEGYNDGYNKGFEEGKEAD